MISAKNVGTAKRESLTLTNKAKAYLSYSKIIFRKINKKYLMIEML